MEKQTIPCHECGGIMRRGVKDTVLSYKGEQSTIAMPGWYCKKCDESVHTGEDMEISDRALHILKAKVDKLLTPDEVRNIRKKLHLSQAEAGKYLGGGPRAFQKYEKGVVMVSKSISNLLFLLDKHPDMLEELKKRE